jgi:hypothetical protein
MVQKAITNYTRIGIIQTVDSINGTCTVKWADHPGVRINVILTQASPDDWDTPVKGDVALIEFDQWDRAYIVRYINRGQAARITQSQTLPSLKEGEKIKNGPNGSYIYFKQNGDIELATANQGYITLENGTGTNKSEAINQKDMTDGGIQYFGLVQRLVPNITGSYNSQVIQNELGENYVEYHLQVLEFGNSATGVTGVVNPIVDITLGTLINTEGLPVATNGLPTVLPLKQLAVNIALPNGTMLTIDKQGRIKLSSTTLNLNNGSVDLTDPDVALTLEPHNATLGNRGQHVAREHDVVTIPLPGAVPYTDVNHTELTSIAAANLFTLQQLAQAFISPAGPCQFNPALIPGSSSLQGTITAGAANLYAGDA